MRIWSFFEALAPSFANWKDCRKIRKKIDSGEGCNPPSNSSSYEDWTIDDLRDLYESEKTRKSKFEDKAKTNVIGITITVTLIMGAYTLLQNVENKYSIGVIYWIAFIFFVLSVIYMLAAGLHAIHVITSENVVHKPEPKCSDNERKKEYNITIAMNRARDLIRNNYVFTSYECIRNALFCLFIVMVIAVFPLYHETAGSIRATRNNNLYYSTQAMKSLNEGIDQNLVEAVIDNHIALGQDEGIYSIIDDTNQIFIKYSVNAGKVDVYLIEEYTH